MIKQIKHVTTKLKNKLVPTDDNGAQYIIGLDIGTEFVKALITKVNQGGAEIVGVGRKRQGLDDMHSGAIADISSVVANCNEALTVAEEQAKTEVRKAVIGIAGELVKGTTTTVNYKRPDKNEEITLEEMEKIIERVQRRAYDQAKKQIAWETGNQDIDIKLVNSAIVSISIDSYKVSNPIGFQGKDVAVQIYTAFAPIVHIGALERVAAELDLDLIAVAAEPFAVARSVIGDDASNNLSAILVDVGGGTTDIALVDDGGVQGTKMFGIGGRAFTRKIANDLDVNFDEAEQIKLQLNSGNLEVEEEKLALQAISKILSVWLEGVKLALEEFKTTDHLPSLMLLCGGGSSLQPLQDALKQTSWYKDLPFTRQPSIKLITPDHVVGIVDKTGKANDHTFVTAMGLVRVGIDTISTIDVEKLRIRDKLNRLLNL